MIVSFALKLLAMAHPFDAASHQVQALGDGRTIMTRGRLPMDLAAPDPKLLPISEGFRMIVLANRGLVSFIMMAWWNSWDEFGMRDQHPIF